jgi:hypothetical protein
MWIFIIPVGILSIPLVITKQEPDEWGMRLAGGIGMWGMLFILSVMLFPFTYFFYGWFPSKSTFGAWQIIGICIWEISIICAIIWGLLQIGKKRREKKRLIHRKFIWNEDGDYIPNPDYVPYEGKPNIIIEFIMAKYHKYCPKIDWE